ALVEPERVERPRLVLGERLGGVEVDRPRLGVRAQDVERGEVEAQRLPRGCARGDDRRARPGGLERLGLMRVERLDPRSAQAVAERRVEVGRYRHELRLTSPLERLA